MEFKFTKTAGSDDFHQELTDVLMSKYLSVDYLLDDILLKGRELNAFREKKEGCFSFTVEKIDLLNEIIFIDWVGIGG